MMIHSLQLDFHILFFFFLLPFSTRLSPLDRVDYLAIAGGVSVEFRRRSKNAKLLRIFAQNEKRIQT